MINDRRELVRRILDKPPVWSEALVLAIVAIALAAIVIFTRMGGG